MAQRRSLYSRTRMRAPSTSRQCLRRALVALALLPAPLALAGDFDPLSPFNTTPLALIHGLPAFDSAVLLPPGRKRVGLALEAANHFVLQENATERLWLDGETHRAIVTLKYRARSGEWGLELSRVSHEAGFLDRFIESWHDAFALPQSGRDATPRNQLVYRYVQDGTTRLNLLQPASGVGDIRLLGGWPLAAGRVAGALRASLKLPTGDANALLGSGGADFAVWLAAQCAGCSGRWGWNASAGVLVLGRGDVLPELQRSLAVFAGGGIGWRAGYGIVLKAELRGHTPFYRNTGVRTLGTAPMQLIVGGTWKIAARTVVELAVTEDARVETTPDVGLLLAIRAGF